MIKCNVTVKVEYKFFFEPKSKTKEEIKKEAEDYWNNLVSVGLEGGKYHDTEIDFYMDK